MYALFKLILIFIHKLYYFLVNGTLINIKTYYISVLTHLTQDK